MGNTFTIHNDIEYVSARDAARVIGYASDYISRLCRQKKISGYLAGKSWYVDLASLKKYESDAKVAAEARRVELSRRARNANEAATFNERDVLSHPPSLHNAHVAQKFIAALDAHEARSKRRHSQQVSAKSSRPSLWHDARNRAVALALAFGLAYGFLIAAHPATAVYTYHEIIGSAIAQRNAAREEGVRTLAAFESAKATLGEIDLASSLTATATLAADFARDFSEFSLMNISRLTQNFTTTSIEIYAISNQAMQEMIHGAPLAASSENLVSSQMAASASTHIELVPDTSSSVHHIPLSTYQYEQAAAHQEILCVGTPGNETCITKTQLDAVLTALDEMQGQEVVPSLPGDSISFFDRDSNIPASTNITP